MSSFRSLSVCALLLAGVRACVVQLSVRTADRRTGAPTQRR